MVNHTIVTFYFPNGKQASFTVNITDATRPDWATSFLRLSTTYRFAEMNYTSKQDQNL